MDLIDSALNRIELHNQTQDNLLATKEELDSETTRATAKENELSENINAETARAENSENEIMKQLNVEITRAMQAEETVSNNLEAHNTSSSAHNDIRLLISGLTTRLNSLADSDDTTLDQLSEIVAYIKNNKSLIDGITTGKVNVSDIIDNLTSTAVNKPLSGKQGKVLKDLIDALTTAVGNKVDKISGKGLSTNDYTTVEKNKLSGIASGAEVNVQSDWNSTDTANDAYIKNKPTALPANGGTAKYTNYLNAQNIATNTDLNSITTPGFYYSPANATVATFTNSPTQNAFFLVVGRHAGTYQEVIEYMTTSPKRYMRNYYNNTWGSWYRVYTTADAPPDTKYALPLMTASVRGGAKIGYTANGKNYPVQLSNEQMYVNVPWTDTNTTYSNMVAATASAAGKAGLVPAPAAGKQTSFLRGDGLWINVVTGIKGNKESAYRTGNVNISPGHIGAVSADDGNGNIVAGKNEYENYIKYMGYTNSCTIINGKNNKIEPKASGAPCIGNVILGGEHNTISGIGSIRYAAIIAGYYAESNGNQLVTGHYNDINKSGCGIIEGTGTDTAFCIGNGTSSAKSNSIRGDYNGKLWCKSAYSSTGADYAELFEWQDSNQDNEDRRGYFVTMDGDKIRKAHPGDWILGIVSANPCVLGNTDTEWQGQFLKDEFGAYLTEEFTEIVTRTRIDHIMNENGEPEDVEVEYEEEITGTRYVLNPDYDPDAPYVDRMSRPEWDAVGMMGVLAVYDDGTCEVNGFCSCGDNGIATASDSGYRVIKRVNDNIVKVVFR